MAAHSTLPAMTLAPQRSMDDRQPPVAVPPPATLPPVPSVPPQLPTFRASSALFGEGTWDENETNDQRRSGTPRRELAASAISAPADLRAAAALQQDSPSVLLEADISEATPRPMAPATREAAVLRQQSAARTPAASYASDGSWGDHVRHWCGGHSRSQSRSSRGSGNSTPVVRCRPPNPMRPHGLNPLARTRPAPPLLQTPSPPGYAPFAQLPGAQDDARYTAERLSGRLGMSHP